MEGAYRLRQVNPTQVAFSGSNPRGESPEEISRDPSFEQLKDSVYNYGVLVPIVVHEQPGGPGKPYRLVDGERRLRAALETGVKQIPAHIAPSHDSMEDLTQAVHIHMLRKQWRAVAQARALRRIIKELRRRESRITEREALERLQALTGCTETKLKSLRRAARYPEKVLSEVDDDQIAFSHLVQFEESFVEQLEQHYPALLQKLGKKEVRGVLLSKARKKVLTSTRALMENVAPVIARAESKEQKAFVLELLESFVTDEDMPAEDVLSRYEKRFPTGQDDMLTLAERLTDATETLRGVLEQLRGGELSASFPEVARSTIKCLTELRTQVSRTLRTLTRPTR